MPHELVWLNSSTILVISSAVVPDHGCMNWICNPLRAEGSAVISGISVAVGATFVEVGVDAAGVAVTFGAGVPFPGEQAVITIAAMRVTRNTA